MAPQLKENKIAVILIQIDEAHSEAWPMALENQPTPQHNFDERVSRANDFARGVENVRPPCPYPVYVDDWSNAFAEKFRAWPDQYHCVDRNLHVVGKSEYGIEGEQEALVLQDYTILLEKLMSS